MSEQKSENTYTLVLNLINDFNQFVYLVEGELKSGCGTGAKHRIGLIRERLLELLGRVK